MSYYCHVFCSSVNQLSVENSDCSENRAANKNTHLYVDMPEIHVIQASCVLCKRIRINPHADYFQLSTLETMVKSWVFENQFQVRVLNLLHSTCDRGWLMVCLQITETTVSINITHAQSKALCLSTLNSCVSPPI